MIITQPYFICGPLVNGNGMRGRRPYKTAVMHIHFVPDTAMARWYGGTWHARTHAHGSRCLLGGCEGYGS